MLYSQSEQNKFMQLAIKQAKKAYDADEVPVGCVIVQNGKVIARAYNKKEKNKCSIFHAEIIAIQKACKKIGDWRLEDCTLFVTMEPCAMCAGAILNHRIKNVVFGVSEKNFGACGGGIDLLNNKNLNSKTNVVSGILKDECLELLQTFFKHRRNELKN